MKNAILLCLVVTLAGCAAQRSKAPVPLPVNADHVITLTWSQSFANNVPCSSSVTKSCISGFLEGYLDTAGAQQQLHTDTAAVCAGSSDPQKCQSTFNGVLPIGDVTFYVVTTFADKNGAAGTTAAVTSPAVNVKADPATNVTATVN